MWYISGVILWVLMLLQYSDPRFFQIWPEHPNYGDGGTSTLVAWWISTIGCWSWLWRILKKGHPNTKDTLFYFTINVLSSFGTTQSVVWLSSLPISILTSWDNFPSLQLLLNVFPNFETINCYDDVFTWCTLQLFRNVFYAQQWWRKKEKSYFFTSFKMRLYPKTCNCSFCMINDQ